MVIVMSTAAGQEDVQYVLDVLVGQGCRGELTIGVERTIITVVGPTTPALQEDLRVLPEVDSVVLLGRSYKLASRESRPAGSIVQVEGVRIGDGGMTLIAGPGAVESEEQVLAIAQALKRAGVSLLSGGAMRPGQSPYAFRGIGEAGLRYLAHARAATGLPIMSEAPSVADVETVAAFVDIVEIGASNTQNYGLLEAAARCGKAILLHRGPAMRVDEWLLSAEHILHAGNPRVILCESGLRAYDQTTESVLDISAVPVLRALTHLPILVDPGHGAGAAALVPPLALAALAAGADGLSIQVHPDPERAMADGPRSLTLEQYATLVERLQPLAAALGRAVTLSPP